MEQQPIKLGKIPKTVRQLFSFSEGDDVWMTNDFLDSLASRYPADYLRKVEEVAHILKEPQYGAYDAKEGILYLLREYVKGSSFCKVYLAILDQNEKRVVGIGVLTPKKINELGEEISWQIIPQARSVSVGISRRAKNSKKSKRRQPLNKEDKS